MQDVLNTVAIADITVSTTNPRKHFDEDALTELSRSIAQYGVMTPVLLRPLGEKYELVCGERRYRASLMAGKTEIPANIRNLSDDEAFELQIIENLERKEVHPLDEAEAFRRMLDSGKYQLQDIATKLAKTEVFVTQRLKLNDLTENIKRDFFNGELNLSQAVLVARLEHEHQDEIYEGYKDRSVPGYGTTKQLQNFIDKVSIEMDTATFSLDKQYRDLPICNVCPKRTCNNTLLFPDYQDKDSCMDKKCFRIKTEHALIEKIHSLYDSGKPIYIGKSYGVGPTTEIVETLNKLDIQILEEYKHYWEWSTGGPKVEIFYISGNKVGQFKEVYLKKQTADSTVHNGTGTYTEIQRLEDREKRAKELDEEKVHAKILEELAQFFKSNTIVNIELEQSFFDAMLLYMAVLKSPIWTLFEELKNMDYPLEKEYKSMDKLLQDMQSLTIEQKKQILLRIMYREFRNTTSGTGLHGQIIRHLAAAHPKIDVTGIQKAQDEIAEKRGKRVAEKIAELKPEQSKKSKKK